MAKKTSKRKTKVTKTSRKAKSGSLWNLITVLAVLSVGVWGFNIYKASRPNVLGANTILADRGDQGDNQTQGSNQDSQSGSDTNSKPEVTDIPEVTQKIEPTDIPEKAQQTEQIQNQIERQVQNKEVNQIEVQPPSEGSDSGKVLLQSNNMQTQELKAPITTQTSVTQINTANAGTVSVRVGGPNNVTIENGPYTISSQFPVVIDPTTNTIAIKTPSGVTIIKTLPVQAFQNLPTDSQLSSVSAVTLTSTNGTPVYQAQGVQIRKLFGLIPVQAPVQLQVNAQNGQVVSTKLPWYYSLFGFAFQSI